MKYIRTYEDLKYNIIDFSENSYWRYRSNIDCIIKIESINSEYNTTWYKCNFLNLKTNKYSLIMLTSDDIQGMIDLKIDYKILRPATDDEIIEHNIKLDSNKYNL